MKMAHKEQEKINIFSDPEKIDILIKNKLASLPAKNGKGNSIKTAWSEEELQLRDAVVLQYITEQGLSKMKTAQQLMDRWGITLQCAYNYINDALDRFTAVDEDNAEKQRKIWLERCETILQDCLDTRDKKSALKALDLIGKSMGIYKDKTDINLSGGADIKFDFQ